MDVAGAFTVPSSHPSLPGHFPGRPVVPGVVLLDEVFAVLSVLHRGRVLTGLPRVKFTHPVLPGQEVVVHAGPSDGGRVPFLCRVAGRDVLGGTMVLGPA